MGAGEQVGRRTPGDGCFPPWRRRPMLPQVSGTEDDDGIDPALAPSIEEAISRIVAAKLRERFPGIGLSAKAACALADAFVPRTETVVELVRQSDGMALVLRPARRRFGSGAPPPKGRRRRESKASR